MQLHADVSELAALIVRQHSTELDHRVNDARHGRMRVGRIQERGCDTRIGHEAVPQRVDAHGGGAGVPSAVAVPVLLAGVRLGRAVVAIVTPAVVVQVALQGIEQQTAVVESVRDRVPVRVICEPLDTGRQEAPGADPSVLPRADQVVADAPWFRRERIGRGQACGIERQELHSHRQRRVPREEDVVAGRARQRVPLELGRGAAPQSQVRHFPNRRGADPASGRITGYGRPEEQIEKPDPGSGSTRHGTPNWAWGRLGAYVPRERSGSSGFFWISPTPMRARLGRRRGFVVYA